MDKDTLQDKVSGSLVGGAVGDALGYPVEFIFSFKDICSKYGDAGITEYDLSYPWIEDSKQSALFSDDTQMTLYTAEGLLEAVKSGAPILQTISDAYLAWFGGQTGRKVKIGYDSELAKIRELNQRRAPGNTCLSALFSVYSGKAPMNNSKGCGGIMRVAPIGLYGAAHGWAPEEVARLAGEAAELTHLHPLSTYSSAALAVIVQLCVADEAPIDKERFKLIIAKSMEVLEQVYGTDASEMEGFRQIVRKAVDFANCPLGDWEIIENELGGGWVAEETLAISIFSVLRHIADFEACMVCAVNHGGDSDSTGAVAGNILGAILGYGSIPAKYTSRLQLLPLLLSTTARLTE